MKQQLPQYMRFIGKPEVLADTFLLETNIGSGTGAMLTDDDIQPLLQTNLALEPDETRLGLFAIRLDHSNLNELKKMRKAFPARTYNLLKNKLRGRKNRLKKRNNL